MWGQNRPRAWIQAKNTFGFFALVFLLFGTSPGVLAQSVDPLARQLADKRVEAEELRFLLRSEQVTPDEYQRRNNENWRQGRELSRLLASRPSDQQAQIRQQAESLYRTRIVPLQAQWSKQLNEKEQAGRARDETIKRDMQIDAEEAGKLQAARTLLRDRVQSGAISHQELESKDKPAEERIFTLQRKYDVYGARWGSAFSTAVGSVAARVIADTRLKGRLEDTTTEVGQDAHRAADLTLGMVRNQLRRAKGAISIEGEQAESGPLQAELKRIEAKYGTGTPLAASETDFRQRVAELVTLGRGQRQAQWEQEAEGEFQRKTARLQPQPQAGRIDSGRPTRVTTPKSGLAASNTSSNLLMLVVWACPAILGGLIVWRRPRAAVEGVARLDGWLIAREKAARQKTSGLAKWIAVPFLAFFRKLGDWVGSIQDEHVRAAVRLTSSLYATYILLFGLWFLLGTFGESIVVGAVVALFVIFWAAVIVGAIWGFLKFRGRKKRRIAAAQAEAARPDIEAWRKLGATMEERERNIKQMFDSRRGAVSFGTRLDFEGRTRSPQGGWTTGACFIQFRISRDLAAMEQREREFLRTTFLLYNSGLINEDQWRHYRFAFINGNGKASIDAYNYYIFEDTTGIKDGPSAVRFYQDSAAASADSAVNALLGVLEKLGQQPGPPAVVKEVQGRLRGGSAWLTTEELPGSMFSGGGPYAVRLGMLDGTNQPLTYAGEGSLITIAPPGSGKTQCFVLPNMLNWPGAAVVLDVKGEIYAGTSKWRSQNVGPVFKFSPLDPANSHSYNPLVFIRQDPEFLWEDARFLADMMIVPSGAADPFWENMSRDVLTAAIAYVCYLNAPAQRPLSKVIDLVYGMGWDDMTMALKTNLAVAAMRQVGHSLADMEKKTRDSVLKTAQSSLSAWQGERLSKVTRKSDWSPLDLRAGKATIYICVNPNEIDSYLSVLRVFIAQHIRMLTSQLPPRDAVPVLFVLDELPRLRKMPPVDEALNTGRQYGIRLWMFAQSYGQLKDAYTNAEGMLGSCAVRTFMNVPLNDELAQKLSDQLGFREGPLDATRTKLVEPIELAGPNFRDIALVVATNTKPAKVRKGFAFQDPELSARKGSL